MGAVLYVLQCACFSNSAIDELVLIKFGTFSPY
jgi:hypothetical protein